MNVRVEPRHDVPKEKLEFMRTEGGCSEVRALWAIADGQRFSVLISRDPIDDPRKGILELVEKAVELGPYKEGEPEFIVATRDFRWHVSIAGQDKVPAWKYLVAITHHLRPGVCFCVPMPPKSWWINVNPNVIHLWETKDENLTEQWRYEGQGHKPT